MFYSGLLAGHGQLLALVVGGHAVLPKLSLDRPWAKNELGRNRPAPFLNRGLLIGTLFGVEGLGFKFRVYRDPFWRGVGEL